MNRLTEASSFAGLALVFHGLTTLFADWKNPVGWADTLGGIAAILKREQVAN